MNLKELVYRTNWCDVKASLINTYPDAERSIEGYELVFSTLSSLITQKTNMRIFIESVFREGIDKQPFVDVSGKNGTLNRNLSDFQHLGKPQDSEYANSEASFALEMVPWEEWLDMEIDSASRQDYSDSEILAHCLWEMTFFGFDQTTISNQKEELDRRIKELDNMTEEEKKERLIPMEQVLKKIETKLTKPEKLSEVYEES